MTNELYAAIKGVLGVADVFDTKLEDAYDITDSIVVASVISETPSEDLSRIAGIDTRLTLEVQAVDLTAARSVKSALITALHGWNGGPITSCQFENGGPELYDSELVPPRYCLPVDFIITN